MKQHRILLLLLLIGLATRIAVPILLFKGETRLPDEVGYLEAGRNLLTGKGLYLTDERFAPPMRMYANRLPGYPLFVAICGGSADVVRVVQAALDTLTALCAFLITRRWIDGWPPLLAAALVLFNPFLIYFSGLILSETLFTAMLAWGMWLMLRGTRRAWFVGLCIIAASVLVRPSAILLPIVCAAVAAVQSGRLRTCSGRIVVALLMTVVALLPWAIRNRMHPQIRSWIWTTTNSGMVQWDGLHPGADGSSDQRFVRAIPELSTMTEVEQDRYLSRLSRQSALADPLRIGKLGVKKVARTWSPIPLSSEYGRPIYQIIAIAFAGPFYMMLLLGLWRMNLPRSAKVLLLAPALYFTVVHALTVGSLRYRVPVEPLLAIVAASGIARRSRPND